MKQRELCDSIIINAKSIIADAEELKLKEEKIRADAIDEFIKNVLTELNGIAEDDDYYFDKDNVNLVSSVLYGQQFVMEKERKQ